MLCEQILKLVEVDSGDRKKKLLDIGAFFVAYEIELAIMALSLNLI